MRCLGDTTSSLNRTSRLGGTTSSPSSCSAASPSSPEYTGASGSGSDEAPRATGGSGRRRCNLIRRACRSVRASTASTFARALIDATPATAEGTPATPMVRFLPFTNVRNVVPGGAIKAHPIWQDEPRRLSPGFPHIAIPQPTASPSNGEHGWCRLHDEWFDPFAELWDNAVSLSKYPRFLWRW